MVASQQSYSNVSIRISVTKALVIEAGGLLTASEVILSPTNVWNSDASLVAPVYGRPSDGRSGGAGGGNAGFGSSGSNNPHPGSFNSYFLAPEGSGGPGGLGPRGAGGAGGSGIYLVVFNDFVLHGTLQSSGGSAAIGSGAGGGAGGVIVVDVRGTISGTGAINADGGHGGVSPVSGVHGGGGSGGYIHVDVCTDGFEGSTSALGGLSIDANEPSLQESRFLTDYNNQYSRTAANHITSGAGGIIRYTVGSPAKCSAGQVHSYRHDFQVSCWEWGHMQGLQSNLDLFATLKQALNISNIVIHQASTTVLYLMNDVNFTLFTLSGGAANVKVFGRGSVSLTNITGSGWQSSVLEVSNGIALVPKSGLGKISISNITLVFQGLFDSVVSTVFRLARVIMINAETRVLGKIYPFAWFNQMSLHNSTIEGSFVRINASSIFIDTHSAITSDGWGPRGGGAGEDIAQGIGAGRSGNTGGSGGGHGGRGILGINALHEAKTQDELLGTSELSINLNGGKAMAINGQSYGDAFSPVTPGSGGGSNPSPYGRG